MEYLKRNLSMEDVFAGKYLYRDFLGLQAYDAELTGVSILTDEKGAVFRGMAIEAVKNDVGLKLLEEVQDWMSVVQVNGLAEADYAAESRKLDEALEEYDGMEMQISENESVFLEARPVSGISAAVSGPLRGRSRRWSAGLSD